MNRSPFLKLIQPLLLSLVLTPSFSAKAKESSVFYEAMAELLVMGYFLGVYEEPFNPVSSEDFWLNSESQEKTKQALPQSLAYPTCTLKVLPSDTEDLIRLLGSTERCQLELSGIYTIHRGIEISKPLISVADVTCDLSSRYNLDQSMKTTSIEPETGFFTLSPSFYPQHQCPSAILIFDEGRQYSRATVKGGGRLDNLGIIGKDRILFEFDPYDPVSVVTALSVPLTTALTVYSEGPVINQFSGRGQPFRGKITGGQKRAANKQAGITAKGSATDDTLLSFQLTSSGASISGGAGDDDPKKHEPSPLEKLKGKFLAYTRCKDNEVLSDFVAAFNDASYNVQKDFVAEFSSNKNYKSIRSMKRLQPRKGVTL